jgi:large subunit ribosomal protein L18
MKIRDKRSAQQRRHLRIRRKMSGTAERPRLMVYRSLDHIYAQVIDDALGQVLAAASTRAPEVRKTIKSPGNCEAAKAVGRQIAALAKSRGVTQVCFDRGGRRYHGRVKALAEAAREAGLVF